MSRWRPIDHVAVWCQAIAVVGGTIWFAVEHRSFDIGSLPILALLLATSLLGFVAGIASAWRGRARGVWLPALLGVVPGAAIFLILASYFSPCVRVPAGSPIADRLG